MTVNEITPEMIEAGIARKATSNIGGFLYGNSHVIRDHEKEAKRKGPVVLWKLESDDYAAGHDAMLDEIERIEMRQVLTAALAAAPAPHPVAVKPLEWTPWTGSASYTHSMVGDYSVDMDHDEDMSATPYVAWMADESLGHFGSLEEAQSAIQSEHEDRIRSELTITTTPGVLQDFTWSGEPLTEEEKREGLQHQAEYLDQMKNGVPNDLLGEIAYALTKRLVIDISTARAAVDEAVNSLMATSVYSPPALAAAPAPQPVDKTDAEDEAYELGKRDGYSEAVQQIDQLTGGDGEYRYCTDHDPDRHTPGPAEMIQRIVDRFEILNLLHDTQKSGRDQEWGLSNPPAEIDRMKASMEGYTSDANNALAAWVSRAPTPQPVAEPVAWRVFEDASGSGKWWGIEKLHATNDDDTILFPIKAPRERVQAIVDAHNSALAPAQTAEIDRLRAENERLREALEPFSKMAGVLFERNFNASDILFLKTSSIGMQVTITAGDYFNARRAALAKEGE